MKKALGYVFIGFNLIMALATIYIVVDIFVLSSPQDPSLKGMAQFVDTLAIVFFLAIWLIGALFIKFLIAIAHSKPKNTTPDISDT